MPSKPPFILFFVRWPEPSRVKTRLAATLGADRACHIHGLLAERCFSNAMAVRGARVVICGTGAGPDGFRRWLSGASAYWEQPVGDLGERLDALFGRAFEEGASKVVAVGSDSPELHSESIAEAIGALDSHEICLLPATDGGYVLVGSCRHFPEIFHDMPWSTGRLLNRTLHVCAEFALRVHIGPAHRDVDTDDDWNLVRAAL